MKGNSAPVIFLAVTDKRSSAMLHNEIIACKSMLKCEKLVASTKQ